MDLASRLHAKINDKSAVVGIIGLGYVGLPLALTAIEAGYYVRGFDIDAAKKEMIERGQTYLSSVDATRISNAVKTGCLSVTANFNELQSVDVIVICVPTPLSKTRDPNLDFVIQTTNEIARTLNAGQLVILESTTYPGTTNEILKPILDASGLLSGQDYFLAYSPEREDPGNEKHQTQTIPKLVGADDENARALSESFYSSIIENVIPVSSSAVAEAAKLTENIFRSVNIALVNELKVIYEEMGINVWEVIDAAATKPFGFMPFYPGPGLGGHCIPIDPFYLTWKAREFGIATRFIELAGEINTAMPARVVEKTRIALDEHCGLALSKSRLLIVGVAYKKNVNDMRESPALVIMDDLLSAGATVEYFDEFVPEIPKTREHPNLTGRESVSWQGISEARIDAALIITDHSDVDYTAIAQQIGLVIDCRNALKSAKTPDFKVVTA